MTTIGNCIMFLLWLTMIFVRVLFRKEFSAPIGNREMRYTNGEWAGWFVLSCFVFFFALLFSAYSSLPYWIIAISFMVVLLVFQLNVINWRIVYTDSEFIYRNTFRFASKYRYEEIVDLRVLHPYKDSYKQIPSNSILFKLYPQQKFDVQVHLYMPDKVIRFESKHDDGKFLTVLLRKLKRLK